VVTLAIWGEVTTGAILTKCGLWGDIVDVITCAIFCDCRLIGVGVVRGASLPSPIDFTRRTYNTGHRVMSSPNVQLFLLYSCIPKVFVQVLNPFAMLQVDLSDLEVSRCHHFFNGSVPSSLKEEPSSLWLGNSKVTLLSSR